MKNKGFTLTELSVSLLVIGLIMGSMVMSAKMIQYAKIRGVAKEIATLTASIYSFYDHYNAIPGDMSNATSFWSGTVNGNGDNIVQGDYISANSPESYRLWQHLGLSGFYPQNFTGTSSGSAPTAIVGTNVPGSVVEGAFYILGHTNVYGNILSVNYQHFMHFGTVELASGGDNMGASLSPKDGYSLDVKIDDGIAYTGNLFGMVSNAVQGSYGATACASQSANSSYPFGYNLSSGDSVYCRFFFWLNLGLN